MKVTKPDFEEYVQENYILREYGENDNVKETDETGYFSSDDINNEDTEEVTDSYFYEHLFDDTDLKAPPELMSSHHSTLETNVDLFDEVTEDKPTDKMDDREVIPSSSTSHLSKSWTP